MSTRSFALLRFLGTFLCLCVCAGPATGADPHELQYGPALIGPQPAPTPVSPAPLATELPAETGIGGTEGEYWIVDARRCPIQGSPQEADTCFQFLRRDVDGLQTRPREEFFGSLQPGVPICFFIHGSYTSWEQSLLEAEGTFRWLRAASPDRPLHMVFYSWPSNTHVTYVLPQIDLAVLGRRSTYNSLYLGRLISQIPADHPVSLVGHSHGARMAASTLHLLAG